MAIRPANTVTILARLLEQAEQRNEQDAMELIGIHDELSRLERKWVMQVHEGNDRRRPATDAEKLADWYRRLTRLIERARRQTPASTSGSTPESTALDRVMAAIESRSPFPLK